ncbi:hypothetical protein [Pseudoxanthomonas sp. 3HH-4]|uniref:hypothetical protein n=1 Tax=Pseudoxanthomonas sp. 3HH-4 TaxID=1690214 RepID=UPI001152102E|nr:hypothetical protein [Pseudoxanthomonas sp. 3HH-4]
MSKDKDQQDSVASGTSSTSPDDPRASEEFDGIPDDLDFEPAVPVGKKADGQPASWWARVFGIHSTWDRTWLGIAITLIVGSIYLALSELIPQQDPAAHMNALLLGLLLASAAVAMCTQIRTRAWGIGFAVAGVVIWAMDVVYGAGGDIGALGDVFCRGVGCR